MMYSCIETIRWAGGQAENLALHDDRMNRTRKALWGAGNLLTLSELIDPPPLLSDGIYKCRVTYREEIEQVEWEPYTRRQTGSLRLVYDNRISYHYKYRQRHDLDRLFSQRAGCDDILIVRDGYLTDTYVCNIALFDGERWYTPDTPLLNGTQRTLLLQQGIIYERSLSRKDLSAFAHVRLFNAMMPWEEAIEISVSRILDT